MGFRMFLPMFWRPATPASRPFNKHQACDASKTQEEEDSVSLATCSTATASSETGENTYVPVHRGTRGTRSICGRRRRGVRSKNGGRSKAKKSMTDDDNSNNKRGCKEALLGILCCPGRRDDAAAAVAAAAAAAATDGKTESPTKADAVASDEPAEIRTDWMVGYLSGLTDKEFQHFTTPALKDFVAELRKGASGTRDEHLVEPLVVRLLEVVAAAATDGKTKSPTKADAVALDEPAETQTDRMVGYLSGLTDKESQQFTPIIAKLSKGASGTHDEHLVEPLVARLLEVAVSGHIATEAVAAKEPLAEENVVDNPQDRDRPLAAVVAAAAPAVTVATPILTTANDTSIESSHQTESSHPTPPNFIETNDPSEVSSATIPEAVVPLAKNRWG